MQEPTRTVHSAGWLPVQPRVMLVPGVHVKVCGASQPQSASTPVVGAVVQLRAMLMVPASGVPASGAGHIGADRTQVPLVGHIEATVGPTLLPFWQVPPPQVHHPQRVLATHAAQSRMSAHSVGGQRPQSSSQLEQVSLPLQGPSPQRGAQTPQSRGQLVQVSLLWQVPSPQLAGQAPQSAGQEAQFSVLWQVASPQRAGQGPQSIGQVLQVSVPLQVLSPQRGG